MEEVARARRGQEAAAWRLEDLEVESLVEGVVLDSGTWSMWDWLQAAKQG